MIDYQTLGARTLINASGTITTLGGSLMPTPVLEAMQAAATRYVDLPDLLVRCGEYLAGRIGVPAAFISCGAASGVQLAVAACLTGADADRVGALPHTSGWKNEIIVSQVDPHRYIHQGAEAVGGTLVRVGTTESVGTDDIVAAFNDRTAAVLHFLGAQSKEQLGEVARAAGDRGIPVIVDAAAQLPPRSNLRNLVQLGASLVVFSGGKGLRGPQSSGLVVGHPELIAAVSMNASPASGIGRGMKVGKEEILGLVAAVDLFLSSTDAEDVRIWRGRVDRVAAQITAGDVQMSIREAGQGAAPDIAPRLYLDLPPARAARVKELLWNGDPPVAIRTVANGVLVDPMTLDDGAEELVGRRLQAALEESRVSARSE